MFKARPAADGSKRTTTISDIRDNVATMLHDKQIKSAKKLALDEQLMAAELKEKGFAATHAAVLRDLELQERSLDIQIKQAQLALLKKQLHDF